MHQQIKQVLIIGKILLDMTAKTDEHVTRNLVSNVFHSNEDYASLTH